VRIRILGTVALVTPDGTETAVPNKEAAVLAALATAPGRPISVDRLVDAVWGDDPPARAVNALQVYVSHLRQALGREAIATGPSGYTLVIDEGEIDAGRFNELAAAGARALEQDEPSRAADLLRGALDLWGGVPFGFLADREWFRPHVTRLEEARLTTLEQRIDADLAAGKDASLVGELDDLVDEHPYRERLHAARLRALYKAGRRADALAAYQHARRCLVDGLGIEPGPELRALQLAVLADDASLSASVEREAAQLQRPPAPVAGIIGRERDIVDLEKLLRQKEVRLVTLVGPGGVGKTRLAIEVADRVSAQYDDGICWLPLAGLNEPNQLLPALASALSVRAGPVPLEEAIALRMRRRQVLVIVDNLEHLLPAAPVLGRLLAAAPRLQMLITSRVAARLAGENRFSVAPLRTTAGETTDNLGSAGDLLALPGVSLFVERARSVQSRLNFSDPDQLVAIAEICRRVDGLPLAIELAAARSDLLPPEALLARLDRRLPLLTTGTADGDDRHTSLRATLDWSVDLLDAPARRLLRRLSVFRGGFTLDGAEAVGDHGEALGAPVLDVLQRLSDASLISPDPGPIEEAEPRLVLLQTVREYAAERLEQSGEMETSRYAHAAYLARALSLRWRGLPLSPRDTSHAMWLQRYGDDFSAALSWTLEQHHDGLLTELALEAAALWDFTGQAEQALDWLAVAADAAPTAERRADIEIWRSQMMEHLGDLDAALSLARQAVMLADPTDDWDRHAFALGWLGFLLEWSGDPEEAARIGNVVLQRDLGQIADADVRALVCTFAAASLTTRHPGIAMDLAQRAVKEAHAAGGGTTQLVTANNLADALLTSGDAAGARHWAQVALDADVWINRNGMRSAPLDNLGIAHLVLGDIEAAEHPLRESLLLADWDGDEILCATELVSHAALAAARGHDRRAILLHAGHNAHMARLGTIAGPSADFVIDLYLSELTDRIDLDTRAQLETVGSRLSLAELVAIAVGAPGQPPLDRDLPSQWDALTTASPAQRIRP
jgi:predicted ATPase/DNA-binding SARP family transcriptional activator